MQELILVFVILIAIDVMRLHHSIDKLKELIERFESNSLKKQDS